MMAWIDKLKQIWGIH